MTRKLLFATLVLLLLGARPAIAQNYEALLERALEKITWEYPDSWAYTETRRTKEATWVGRYDPSRDDTSRWTLLTVDGRQPTPEEAAEWLEDKDSERQQDEDEAESAADSGSDDGDDNNVGMMISPGSLELIEENEQHWLLSFTPKGDDEEENAFMKAMQGTLRISKPGEHLELLDIANDKPVKPKVGVKIRDFKTQLTFGEAFENGLVVPLSFHFRIKGRAYLAVGFDEMESREFSDFEPVSDSLEPSSNEQ